MGSLKELEVVLPDDVPAELPEVDLVEAEQEAASSPRARAFLTWSKRIAIAGWVVLAGLVIWGIQSGVLSSVSQLRAFLSDFGPAAPVIYSLIGASEAIFPVVPGSASIIAAPILFGPVVGFFAAYAATCLGSIAVFFLSRDVGQELLLARFKPATVERYLGWLEHRHFTRWFAIAIALPVAPDDLLCYLAGLSKMRPRTFIIIILLLKPWALLLYVFGVLALLERWIPWLAG
ncbi:TVP38/TMEM64 family protein [Ornithinimicrobium sp. Y1847]|uniref:TVP38/TMEM64 family protein n=1 Tax=unclassified Ornithinimicrobium TaxID=2615080 RepID=UPI003B685E1F